MTALATLNSSVQTANLPTSTRSQDFLGGSIQDGGQSVRHGLGTRLKGESPKNRKMFYFFIINEQNLRGMFAFHTVI